MLDFALANIKSSLKGFRSSTYPNIRPFQHAPLVPLAARAQVRIGGCCDEMKPERSSCAGA